MSHGTTYRGKNRHEHKLVPVPRELRAELLRLFTARRRIAEAIGVSTATSDALMSPFGVVRQDVIDRAWACVARRKETGS